MAHQGYTLMSLQDLELLPFEGFVFRVKCGLLFVALTTFSRGVGVMVSQFYDIGRPAVDGKLTNSLASASFTEIIVNLEC